MSEHIWEEIVQGYLTTNRAMLVSREYEITDEQKWKINPDLLAVDFHNRQVWFVEITSGSDTKKIVAKAKIFNTEIVPRLKNQLARFCIISNSSDWDFGFWAFTREAVTKLLSNRLNPDIKLKRVEALEPTAASWTYWDKRRAEENSNIQGRGAVAS